MKVATPSGLPSHGGTVRLDFSEFPPGEHDVKITCGSYTEWRTLTIAAPKRKAAWKRWFRD